MQVSAGALRRALIGILYTVFLPALVLSVLWQANFSGNTWRILIVMLVTTGAGLAAAWLYYKNKSIANNVKGAFILAAAFGSVLVIGMPITQEWVARWTVRTAVYYEAVVMLPVLFTAGVLLAKEFGESEKSIFGIELIKEPIIIAVILGIILNLASVKMPVLISNWLTIAKLGILPVSLITVGLSLYWHKQWSKLIPAMLPVVIIQLILQPLLLWGFFHLFGVSGVQTFKSMFMQAAMPSMVLGFIICERYKLDTTAYTAVFSFTAITSFITIPVWWTLLQKGIIS
ncbi:MAG: AEC family transporter [Gammaproteobacteria bacterium]|nr:AEC family transporter [Gammaproteobacteria bacterium]